MSLFRNKIVLEYSTPIDLHIDYRCSHTTVAELNSYNKDDTA